MTGSVITITKIKDLGNGSFRWSFSDGTNYTTPDLRGGQGPAGKEGQKGQSGDKGVGIHHIRLTGTTDPNGVFSSFGELDTYTFYGDASEEYVLGWFSIRNGSSGQEGGSTSSGSNDRSKHTGEQAISTVTGLTAELANKVSKDGTKQLSDENFTLELKEAIEEMSDKKFKGLYTSLEALEADQLTGEAGDFAHVDLGVGKDVTAFIYDVSDGKWVQQAGKAAALTATEIRDLFLANTGTEEFTTAFKEQLEGTEVGATKNSTDEELRDRTSHTGMQDMATVTGLVEELADKVTVEVGKGLSEENYTTADKEALDALVLANEAIPVDPKYTDTVYDDTALDARVEVLETVEYKTINGESIIGVGDIEVTGGSGTASAAKDVTFNNTLSDFVAENIQDAIIEVNSRIPTEISANNVNETSERQFLTADQKGAIQANTSGVDNHSLRLAALEAIDPTEADTGKVKLTEADTAGYLSDKIDAATLSALGGVIRATSLSGMGTTIEELNFVQGATGNLQAQINALTSVGNFTGTVDTHSEIATTFPAPAKDDMVIVLEDEAKAGQSTIYLYTGSAWEFAGNFTASVRDFSINKLELESEAVGVLPKANYEKQNALDTPIEDLDNNFTVKNVEGALKELFTSANSFKNAVVASIGSPLVTSDKRADVLTKITDLKGELALAITDKGIPAYPYNTLTELADKIAAIANVEIVGDIKTTDEIVTTNYHETYTIVLNEPVKELQMATTPLVFSNGLFNVAHYVTTYPEEDGFKYQDIIGKSMVKNSLQVSDTYEYPMTKTDEMFYESDEIDFNTYNDFSGYKADINNLSLNLKALPLTGVSVECVENISLNGVDAISKITSTVTKTGASDVKYALSFDGGITWQSFRAGAWVSHTIEDLAVFKSTGMTAAELTAITPVNFKVAMGEAKNFRIAYYLERTLFSETLSQTKMDVLVNTAGTFGLLTTDKYSFTYTPATKTLVYTFVYNGKYKINYLDGA